MKIVVSGATGFLGSWICRVLASQYDVVALVRPDSNLYRLEGVSPIGILKINENQWGDYLQNSGAAAWVSLDWQGVSNHYRNEEFQMTNVNRLESLCSKVTSIPIIVGTGSQAELGPINSPISEDLADAPTTKYGEAKVAVRKVMASHAENLGSRFVWARIFSTYGALDSNDWLIPATIDALRQGKNMPLTGGEQEWSYLHAYDLARAFQVIISQSDIRGVVSVGNPETVQIHEVARLIGKKLKREKLLGFGEVEYRPDQVMKLAPRCETLVKQGWEPRIALEEGISHLINWMSHKPDQPLRFKNGEILSLYLPTRN